ncbi:uncharacterized protein [Oryza sativa Japonica Group]|uniref:Os08g0257100 protein n=3 Tax=Oryza TaxID=4527 RepID=Q6Z584_ORYSJ|nr:uncharacterized protein LOC107275380 [Oryza sativa Japonica Group]KAF2918860.1 hypothetical protein DAI22_08g091500 [Oryza sativa Japonica Group]BAC98647.1 hypothetical protein [Oryza sativa Japonica Group]BAT04588.1 Os08g0257100 [Oryza sativa Japonica Group]
MSLEVRHPARPGCMLTLHGDADAMAFQCTGCMETGKGPRYTSGDHVLHTYCALATPTLQHPLVEGIMELRLVAPTGGDAVRCDACYDAVRGFHYHSSTSGVDLHPGCAKMPRSITLRGGTIFDLRTEVSHRCTSCKAMEGFYRPWFYRSENNPDQRMYLHVKCIKEIQDAGDDDEVRMMVRLQERAGRNVRLERRVCKTLVIMVRIVFRLLIGDPTPILTEGVNAIVSMAMQ